MKKIKIGSLLIIIAIAVVSAVLIWMAGLRSLWFDDLTQIHMTAKGLSVSEVLSRNLIVDNNPPLSHIIHTLWQKVAPYGERWIKLPNVVFCILGTLVCAKLLALGHSKRCAIVTLFILLASRGLIVLAGYTVRAYGLLFLNVSLLLYEYFVIRFKKSDDVRHRVSFGLMIALSAYTHYFSILVCFSLFIWDLFLFVKKDIKANFILPYILGGVLFLPWLGYALPTMLRRAGTFWPENPTPVIVVNTLFTLLGNGKSTFLLFVFCIIVILTVLICRKKDIIKVELCKDNWETMPCVLLSTVVITMGIVYVYSAYIATNGSLWVPRYFVSIIPCLFLLMGIGVEYASKYVESKGVPSKIVNVFLFFMCFLMDVRSLRSIYDGEKILYSVPYREAFDYIMAQNDIYDDDVALYISDYYMPDGWRYYITHAGTRPDKEVMESAGKTEDFAHYRVVYYAEFSKEINMPDLLETDFECVYNNEELNVQRWVRVE